MRVRNAVLSVFLLWVGMVVAKAAPPYTSFKVVSVTGKVTAQAPAMQVPAPVIAETAYPFGTKIQAERDAGAVLEFSPGNTVRVSAKARLVAVQDGDRPNLLVLALDAGRLDVKFDRLPSDHVLQVRTPAGVYGVVGTEFSVFYDALTGGSVSTGATVTRGEVRFDSAAITVPTIAAGDGITIKATEGSVSRVAEISVTRATKITLGADNVLWLAAGTTVRVAMQSVAVATSGIAVRVIQGTASVGTDAARTALTPASAPGFVVVDRIVETPAGEPSAGMFMSAAERESAAGAAIRAAQAAGLPVDATLVSQQQEAATQFAQWTPNWASLRNASVAAVRKPPPPPPPVPGPSVSPVGP